MKEWADAGIEVPMLESVPRLLPHESFLLDHYLKITVPAPIPITEVMAAYSYFEMADNISRADWARAVREMDSVIMDYDKKESEKKK